MLFKRGSCEKKSVPPISVTRTDLDPSPLLKLRMGSEIEIKRGMRPRTRRASSLVINELEIKKKMGKLLQFVAHFYRPPPATTNRQAADYDGGRNAASLWPKIAYTTNTTPNLT